MDGADNVRLDNKGLYWLDGAENERGFGREEVVGFQIGRDADSEGRRVVAEVVVQHAGQ